MHNGTRSGFTCKIVLVLLHFNLFFSVNICPEAYQTVFLEGQQLQLVSPWKKERTA